MSFLDNLRKNFKVKVWMSDVAKRDIKLNIRSFYPVIISFVMAYFCISITADWKEAAGAVIACSWLTCFMVMCCAMNTHRTDLRLDEIERLLRCKTQKKTTKKQRQA